MYRAVLWSAVFGYVMVCTFVLVMPSLDDGAKQGFNIFFWLFDQSQMPAALKAVLAIGIVLANYLCALAGLTSTSRMIFAFARDGGLPWSTALRHVSKAHRTPVYAIWIGGILSIVATLYAGAFIVLATGCAVFLYISYIMPVAAGLLAEGKTWTKKGPFDLKALSKPVAVLAVIGGGILIWVGVQPPNEKVGYLILGLVVALIVLWFAMERKRFQGPPMGEMITKRQKEIMEAERAVGEAGR
jgi:amino acid transporter